jgi:hypothetical protein
VRAIMTRRRGRLRESSAGSNTGDFRCKEPELQRRATVPASSTGVVVPGEALKRRRIIRTTEVTIETEQNIVLRATPDRRSSLVWCPACRRQVAMVAPEQAAQLLSVSPRTIYRWVDVGSVHFVENFGHLLICLPALALHTAGSDTSGPTERPGGSKP